MNKQIQERRFELRSEKVRSIVGQMPSSLVRYGITIIAVVLLCLLIVAHYLPYKKVYHGTAVIHHVTCEYPSDSVRLEVLLSFNDNSPKPFKSNAVVEFQSDNKFVSGQILALSTERDTLGRQRAICCVPLQPMCAMAHQEVDFLLTVQPGSLLSLIFKEFYGK